MTLDLSAERLAAALPFAPHNFVPGLSADGDRALVARHLLRPLEPEHDLRVRHGAAVAFAEVLPWDSALFGLRMARLHGVALDDGDPGPALDALLDRARARGVRYLHAQVDARDTSLARALGARGFALLETRLSFHRELPAYAWPERFPTRLARPADVPALAETAARTINPYDRFHADPALDPAKVDELMRVWVENSVLHGFADATLCPDVPAPRAFCTVSYHRASWAAWGRRMAQPILSAVDPSMKGWYRKLLSEVAYHLRDQGAEHMLVVTQATNKAVVHVWETLGFRYGRCENVLRALL